MKIVHDAAGHEFKAVADDGSEAGHLGYSVRDAGTLSADHTWTAEHMRGQGIAGRLLDAFVAYAAENRLKIFPVCSYVVAAFAKDPGKYRTVAAK